MSNSAPFVKIDLPCSQAVEWIRERINLTGLSVLQTFDLQVARHAQTYCPCPQHGTDQCDCQMQVLLVYQGNRQPVAIVAHGYNGQTELSVVDTPQQRADPLVEMIIRQALSAMLVSPDNVTRAHIAPHSY